MIGIWTGASKTGGAHREPNRLLLSTATQCMTLVGILAVKLGCGSSLEHAEGGSTRPERTPERRANNPERCRHDGPVSRAFTQSQGNIFVRSIPQHRPMLYYPRYLSANGIDFGIWARRQSDRADRMSGERMRWASRVRKERQHQELLALNREMQVPH